MNIITHMIGTAIGVFFRVIFFGLIGAAIVAGATLLISSQAMHQWPPSILTYIVGGAVALLAAYASGITIILRALTRGALTVARDVERDVEKAV